MGIWNLTLTEQIFADHANFSLAADGTGISCIQLETYSHYTPEVVKNLSMINKMMYTMLEAYKAI